VKEAFENSPLLDTVGREGLENSLLLEAITKEGLLKLADGLLKLADGLENSPVFEPTTNNGVPKLKEDCANSPPLVRYSLYGCPAKADVRKKQNKKTTNQRVINCFLFILSISLGNKWGQIYLFKNNSDPITCFTRFHAIYLTPKQL
jgi:hypothetical protein